MRQPTSGASFVCLTTPVPGHLMPHTAAAKAPYIPSLDFTACSADGSVGRMTVVAPPPTTALRAAPFAPSPSHLGMSDTPQSRPTGPQDLGTVMGAPRLADVEFATPAEPRKGVDERPPLWPFYVYELRDPRNNEVFYVGKGTELRMDDHVAGKETRKELLIDEIEAAGLEVKRVPVARFRTEAEAFAVESVLIKWVYGLANLTNLKFGHGEEFIREWEDKASDKPRVIEGLDIERRPPGVRDGQHTAKQRGTLAQRDVERKLHLLRDALVRAEPLRRWPLQFGDVDLYRAGDPGFRVSGFSPSVHMNVDMQVRRDEVKVGLGPERGHREAFVRALTAIPEPFAIKNEGSHARTNSVADPRADRIPFESTGEIIAHIERTIERLVGAAQQTIE